VVADVTETLYDRYVIPSLENQNLNKKVLNLGLPSRFLLVQT